MTGGARGAGHGWMHREASPRMYVTSGSGLWNYCSICALVIDTVRDQIMACMLCVASSCGIVVIIQRNPVTNQAVLLFPNTRPIVNVSDLLLLRAASGKFGLAIGCKMKAFLVDLSPLESRNQWVQLVWQTCFQACMRLYCDHHCMRLTLAEPRH